MIGLKCVDPDSLIWRISSIITLQIAINLRACHPCACLRRQESRDPESIKTHTSVLAGSQIKSGMTQPVRRIITLQTAIKLRACHPEPCIKYRAGLIQDPERTKTRTPVLPGSQIKFGMTKPVRRIVIPAKAGIQIESGLDPPYSLLTRSLRYFILLIALLCLS